MSEESISSGGVVQTFSRKRNNPVTQNLSPKGLVVRRFQRTGRAARARGHGPLLAALYQAFVMFRLNNCDFAGDNRFVLRHLDKIRGDWIINAGHSTEYACARFQAHPHQRPLLAAVLLVFQHMFSFMRRCKRRKSTEFSQ